MIVCHCNVLTIRDIHRAIDDLLAEDPWRVLTPGLVYMTLGKRGKCCGCFPNAVDVINKYVDECHARDDLAPGVTRRRSGKSGVRFRPPAKSAARRAAGPPERSGSVRTKKGGRKPPSPVPARKTGREGYSASSALAALSRP